MRHVTISTPGSRLRAAREAAGLSQDALSRATSIDRSAISNLEHGKVGLGSKRALALAAALNVSPEELLGPPKTSADLGSEDRHLDALLASLAERADGVDAVVAEVLELLTRRLRLAETRRGRTGQRATGERP